MLDCFTLFQFASRSFCVKVPIELPKQFRLYMNSSLALVLSTTYLIMKHMGKQSDMIIPVLNSAFITEFGIIRLFPYLWLFLVTSVDLFAVGIKPCQNIKFTKLWTILLSLISRTLIFKSSTNNNSLLVIFDFEGIF